MFFPSVFGENLADEFDPFRELGLDTPHRDRLFGNRASRLMATDVRESDKTFELDIDIPGFRRSDIHAELKNGYLTISAAKSLETDNSSEKSGRYVRQERWSGNVSRSFYVGEALTNEDITAKYENGILRVTVPKKTCLPKPESRSIAIQ